MTRSAARTRRRDPAPVAIPDPAGAGPASPERREVAVRLADIDIAPENLRYGEAADDQVPQLAATIRAAGLLQHPTARPGRKGEAAWMLLDGRRRLLALRLLREAGDIGDDYPVRLFIETDKARQAAAVVLTNTAAPVHVADVIAAIGRMLKAGLRVAEIAFALGYAEIEIRRLAALSSLPGEAIDALKTGRLNLKQARLLARLGSREEQRELARAALDGHGFQEWRLHERLDQDRVTAHDPRCRLIDPERYVAAGGRLEHDLFGERPPVLLDPEILSAGWQDRVRPLAAMFEARGVAVHVSAGEPPEAPEDQEAVGWAYGAGLSPEQAAAWKEARDAHAEAVEAVADAPRVEDVCAELGPLVQSRIARDQAALGGRAVTAIVLTPSKRTGVSIECWSPREPEVGQADGDGSAPGGSPLPAPDPVRSPVPRVSAPDVGGAGHSLHAVRTDVATRGLTRALADDPEVALTALLARLFTALVLGVHRSPEDAALAITARPYAPPADHVVPVLDGEVRARLETRRVEWLASGLTAVSWVHGLDAGSRLGLLAELVAVTVDLREARTTSIRTPARAVAAELSALCAFDLGEHWTPDAPFLQAHGKTDLIRMLETMGAPHPSATKLKKADLALAVEAEAARRRWTPAALDWAAALTASSAEDPEDDDAATDCGTAPGDEERVGFEVTAAGEAALRHPPS